MPHDVLDRSVRCVLALAGPRAPIIAPMAFWSDGAGLWMSTPADSVKVAMLRSDPACAVYVPPAGDAGTGLVVQGRARVFGLHDPVGLALHGPSVSAAMAALAARNLGNIVGYVQDAPRVPARYMPRNRVAIRVRMDETTPVRPPDVGPGIAPALPPIVSPRVRRELSGRRRVVLATGGAGRVEIGPAVWGAGFALTVPAGRELQPGAPAVATVDADSKRRPTAVMGLALSGRVHGGRLAPERVTTWEGFSLRTVEVPAAASSVVLPD